MSQNDYTIANQTTPLFRADLNSALQALASNSSGATAPATTYANMLWYDTAANILKMRSEADDAWINVAYVDQSANAWRVLNFTQVVNTSGTTIGYLGVHETSTWQNGVDTNDKLVSPAKVKAAIEALVPAGYSDAQARAAQAGHSAGGVGSYGFFFNNNYSTVNNVNTTKNPGHLEAGSSLRWSGSDTTSTATFGLFATAPSGTWRLMGFFDYRENSSNEQTASPRFSLYLRVS